MNVNPYLTFDGNCREAFRFYADCLNTEIQALLTSADIPADAMNGNDSGCAGDPPPPDKILHASIAFEGSLLMGSDWMLPEPYQAPKGFNVSLDVESVAEVERIFAALAAGGEPQVPPMETFFAHAFAVLVDRFGISWMVLCPKEG